jgi:hypothetical protein
MKFPSGSVIIQLYLGPGFFTDLAPSGLDFRMALAGHMPYSVVRLSSAQPTIRTCRHAIEATFLTRNVLTACIKIHLDVCQPDAPSNEIRWRRCGNRVAAFQQRPATGKKWNGREEGFDTGGQTRKQNV